MMMMMMMMLTLPDTISLFNVLCFDADKTT